MKVFLFILLTLGLATGAGAFLMQNPKPEQKLTVPTYILPHHNDAYFFKCSTVGMQIVRCLNWEVTCYLKSVGLEHETMSCFNRKELR